MVEELDWFTIPVVGIISCILLATEDIIVKIGNPFNSKYTKIYLDGCCQELQSEIEIEWAGHNIFETKSSNSIDEK